MMDYKKIAKKAFIDLLGKSTIDDITENNWVSFDCVFKEITPGEYGRVDHEFEMNFREKDGKGDTVIFCSINYNSIDKKWWSENCIDYPYIKFNTYEEMKAHLESIEDDILDNGSTLIEF